MRDKRTLIATLGLAAAVILSGCGGNQTGPTGPRTDLKPFKEISTIELFEKVFNEHGYETSRDKSIHIIGYGPWQVDLWVEGQVTGDSWLVGIGFILKPQETFGM